MDIDNAPIFDIDETKRLAFRLKGRRRLLVWGEMGAGKSTLAFGLSRYLNRSVGGCRIVSLDPGTPLFGIPGAVCRGRWDGERFEWGDCQALCTLDAARFRLPLTMAARRLKKIAEGKCGKFPIVIDPPGVWGASGAELLVALAEIFGVDAVLALHRDEETPPLKQELASLDAEILHVFTPPGGKTIVRE